MPDIKKLLQRNRFLLEVLAIVVLGEFAVMAALDALAPVIDAMHVDLLDAISLTLLVAPFIWWRSLAVHGREAQNLSEAIQHSGTAVVLLDTAGRIYWVNSGFTQMSGYTLEEANGLAPSELLGSGQSELEALDTLSGSLATHQPCRVNVVNRRKDGSHYYIDIDFRPDFDKRGELVGFIEIGTDITELKQAKISLEASLRESEALRQTVDTHAIVSVADRTGRIIDANPAFCAISGYSREQLLGQDHRVLNSGTHSPEFWAAMWDDIARGKPWRGEICNRDKQGKTYWVDSMIAPFLGADGLVEKYVSVRMDITARKATEVELVRQTQLLTEVMDSAPYGLAVYDAQQVLRLHNAQFAEILTLPSELLAKRPFYFSDQVRYQHARGDYAGAQSVDAVLAEFLQAMAERRHLMLERRQFDGRHIELRAYPISGGWTVLNYRDNTEKKNQQLSLVDAKERVRLATESAGIGIWSLNTITGEQTWDPQQYQLFGLDREANAASKVYDLWTRHLHPEDAEQSREAFQHTINNGLPFDHAFRIIRPDGELRYIKALGSPRLDATGRVDYIVGTNMDVTDATLLAASMQRARDLAEEASRVKSQFLANMSHEIRTPMNAVMGMLKLLERTELDVRQRNYTYMAESASRMMVRLIDDILDHAEMSVGRVMLLPKIFRLDALLLQLSGIVSASLGGKEIDVRFDVDPQLPDYLFGDSQRLLQILVNLMRNAIKFTMGGEVVCGIRLQAVDAAHPHVAFCIRDTGIGIAPEFRDLIFNSFTQVQATTTREFDGVGLGLPISQRLVALMGGSIVLESAVGVGSSFSFVLDLTVPGDKDIEPPATSLQGPLQTEFAAARADALVTAEPMQEHLDRPQRLKGLRVLAVDDVQINQNVIEALLTAEGAQVALAANGRMAVDAVIQARSGQAFDLVLMDIQMPVMDGYEATRLIRRMPQLEQLPIIAVTANVLESDLTACLAAGMNRHVGKPYDLDELVAVILSVTGSGPGVQDTAVAMPPSNAQPVEPAVAPASTTQHLHAYWIRATAQQSVPDAAALLQMGVVLQVLESGDALAPLLEAGAPAGLILVDQDAATSATLRALGRSRIGASMKAMPMIALADAPTEDDMRACLRAGAIDMVPRAFAHHFLHTLCERLLNDRDQVQVDTKLQIAAIDSKRAMAQMQSDAPFFGSLLRAFFEELPARTQHLQADWVLHPQHIKHQCHALKGLAMTLGLHQLAEVAMRTEAQATQTTALDGSLLVQLEGEMQSAGFQILRWLKLHQDVLEVLQ